MTSQDRLEAIKARRRVAPKMLLEEDADWLVGEVERLRKVIVRLEGDLDQEFYVSGEPRPPSEAFPPST